MLRLKYMCKHSFESILLISDNTRFKSGQEWLAGRESNRAIGFRAHHPKGENPCENA